METIRRGPMIMQTQRSCQMCDGRGKSYMNERKVKKVIDFYIPAGVKSGEKITLHDVSLNRKVFSTGCVPSFEEGHQLPDMPRGDVIVQFQVKKHSVYKRMGADLAMAKELTLVEALCGFEFHVRGLEEDSWLKIHGK